MSLQLNTDQVEKVIQEANRRGLAHMVKRHFRSDGSCISIEGRNPPWWMLEAAGFKRPDPPPPPPKARK